VPVKVGRTRPLLAFGDAAGVRPEALRFGLSRGVECASAAGSDVVSVTEAPLAYRPGASLLSAHVLGAHRASLSRMASAVRRSSGQGPSWPCRGQEVMAAR